jgi:hypothetical protein
MTRGARMGLVLSLVLAVLCVLVAHARASTDEALRTDLPCSACHVSPAGGGLRTPAAVVYMARERPSFPAGPVSTPPGSRAGTHRRPTVSVGADAALWGTSPPDAPAAVDAALDGALHLAVRPFDGTGDREGRLTLHGATVAGERHAGFRVEHYGVLFDDLMLDLALAAGRQPRPSAAALDGAPDATGVSLHVRPGAVRVWLTAFRPAADPHIPLDADEGTFGGLLVEWQPKVPILAGVAFEGGRAGGGFETRAGVHAGLDLARASGVPLRLASRFGHTRTPGGVFGPHTPAHGLSAEHTVRSTPLRGLDVAAGYGWTDADVDVRYDSSHRVFAALTWHPVPFVSTHLRWDNPWQFGERRLALDADRLRAEVRFGF